MAAESESQECGMATQRVQLRNSGGVKLSYYRFIPILSLPHITTDLIKHDMVVLLNAAR
jgi:hypothetical protein